GRRYGLAGRGLGPLARPRLSPSARRCRPVGLSPAFRSLPLRPGYTPGVLCEWLGGDGAAGRPIGRPGWIETSPEGILRSLPRQRSDHAAICGAAARPCSGGHSSRDTQIARHAGVWPGSAGILGATRRAEERIHSTGTFLLTPPVAI